MSVPSVLAVYAHPDDESLASGGVLAQHAEAGARTAVVTATWAAGTGRAAELAEALRVLGAGAPRLLGYADAKVPSSAPGAPRLGDAPLDEAVGRLVGHLREFRPRIVVTNDAYGGLSGHPDHVRTHRLTMLAVEAAGLERLYPAAGDSWQVEAVYLATHPASAVRALRGLLRDDAGEGAYCVPDEWVTAAVDVRPWPARKWAAVLAHRSEVERGAAPGRLAALPPDVRDQVLATEWYIRHPGGPGTGPRSAPDGELTV